LFEENENLLICNDTELLSIKGVEIGVWLTDLQNSRHSRFRNGEGGISMPKDGSHTHFNVDSWRRREYPSKCSILIELHVV
jgi:hypothetical protein